MELTEDQTKIAIRNSATAFEFTEGPVLNYISCVLNVPMDTIYTKGKPLYQGHLDFEIDGKKYKMNLQVYDSDNNPDSNLVIPGNTNNPVVKQMLENMGFLVFIIKTLTYDTIINSEYTSKYVKTNLKKTRIEFNEETSTFRIVHTIDGSIFRDSCQSVLGFSITEKD